MGWVELHQKLHVAVDFDGTIVENKYPGIGQPIEHALGVLRELQTDKDIQLMLWTARTGKELDAAVEWMAEQGFDWPVNRNPHIEFGRKLVADIYIDDRNIGGLPSWKLIHRHIMVARRRHVAMVWSSK